MTPRLHYSLMSELMASPSEPLPLAHRTHQLTRMWQALASIERSDRPTTEDWRVCSDGVNLMETLVLQGVVNDADGLIMDGVTALAMAGRRHVEGGNIRLDAAGVTAIRAVLEDYATIIASVSARTMIKCHRATEKRVREILAGKRKPHDVEIMAI